MPGEVLHKLECANAYYRAVQCDIDFSQFVLKVVMPQESNILDSILDVLSQ